MGVVFVQSSENGTKGPHEKSMHFGSPLKNSSGVANGSSMLAANCLSLHEKSVLPPVCVCVCVCGMLLGNPKFNFKDQYLVAHVKWFR